MSTYSTTGAAAILSILLFVGPTLNGQQTTNTNCTVYGNSANCTSTTTDNAAQQQRAYEAGQQVGNAIGLGLAAGMQAHAQTKWVRNYCAAHPGEGWRWYSKADGHTISSGRCETDGDRAVAAANVFMSHHKEFIPGPANSQVLVAYLETNKLDPRQEKSYERAYKDLKHSGQLDLYKK
jgi:hypothetical protein